MATQFETNELRGRKYIEQLLPQLGITKYVFTKGQFDSYDIAFYYKGKKCIGEIKYLYKYNNSSFKEAYTEQKKMELMDKAKNSLNADKTFYFFIYNDDTIRIFNTTNWSKYNMVEKLAPKSYSDKTMIKKQFIELPNNKGILTSL